MSIDLEKAYNPKEKEGEIYEMWEKGGYFTPRIDPSKKPFTILLPPPNANASLHLGHILYVVEDILCRWHRMKGEPTLFLPGTDHAGIETQFVFEKKLKEQGKSRFDFDRETLYKIVNEFVESNRGLAKEQLKKAGFSLDWTREKYTLDSEILKTVFETFRKLNKDGLVYRDEGIVNYCTYCGTAFSDLEVDYIERDDFLYYLNYGALQIATTRPETIFADVAVAVNPKDSRYKKLVGKKAILPILNKELPIITDDLVEKDFGTGALKITPSHDPMDFEIGKKNNLPSIKIIDPNGKMINVPEKYLGLYPKQAREAVIAELQSLGKLVKIEPLKHNVGVCYRCKNAIEPMAMPQWFVKIASLAKPALEAVKKGKIKVLPQRFEKLYLQWMENIRDWNISRQIVWGPQIPAWYCLSCNPNIVVNFINEKGEKVFGEYKDLKNQYSFSEIKKGLQSLTAPKDSSYSLEEGICKKCKSDEILQETDTFDTWFSSGQWPLTTLGYPDSSDFKYFYPTSVLDTMWDILFFWVARMIMFSIYLTGKIPFEIAHMHSRVVDKKGQKMSKSKGNVINPIEIIDKYGADALRMALVFSSAPGSDICVGEENFLAMRKFANKIWNAYQFVKIQLREDSTDYKTYQADYEIGKNGLKFEDTPADEKIKKDLQDAVDEITKNLDTFQFHEAAQKIYHFFWHTFCDEYIEAVKEQVAEEKAQGIHGQTRHNLAEIFLTSLKLLHPFMPFITEYIYQDLKIDFNNWLERTPEETKDALIIEFWPK